MARNLLKFKPNISIWLNTKPYDIANNYDIFYYKICIEVYEYLLKEHHDFFIDEEKYFEL